MIRDEQIARLMAAAVGALLIGALGFQYLKHLPPCEMCHWQRWPYFASLAIAFAILPFARRHAQALAWLIVALILVSGGIGLYQTLLQLGLVPGPGACTVAHAYVMGSGAPPPEISCNAVTWSLFGLSLAAYNALFAFVIAGTGALLLKRNHAA